jgi:hypothetical protein
MPLAAKVEAHLGWEITFESAGICGAETVGMDGLERLGLKPCLLYKCLNLRL